MQLFRISKAFFLIAIFFLTLLCNIDTTWAFLPNTKEACEALGGECRPNAINGQKIFGTCGGALGQCAYPKEGTANKGEACRKISCEQSNSAITATCNANGCGSIEQEIGSDICGDTDGACCIQKDNCTPTLPLPPGTTTNPTEGIKNETECNAVKCASGGGGICMPFDDCGASTTPTMPMKNIGSCGANSYCCVQATGCETSPTPTPSTTSPTTSHNTSLNYKTLEDIPGFKDTSADFPTYLKNLYLFAIWVIALSALFMLIVGGFLYLSSAGNNSLISTAKKTISYALMGLIIGLTSWLILNTINPDLTNISLTGFSSSGGNSSAGPSTPITGTPAAGADAAGCNALKYVSVKNQCSLASSAIVSALKCIESAGITNKVYSLTSNGVGGDLAKSKACCGNGGGGDCPHSDVSCHHGCTMGNANKGLSFGADMEIPSGASDTTLCDIANKAKACGIGNIWGPRTISSCGITYQSGHSTHLHLSAAGCAH